MKRYWNILIILLSIDLQSLHAQDTVQYGDSCYLFNTLTEDCLCGGQNYACMAVGGPDFFVKRTIASEVVQVYGVAATIDTINVPDNYTVYFFIEKNGGFQAIDSSSIYSTVSYFNYHAQSNNNDCDQIVPCLEFYFETPHITEGDIFVGIRGKSIDGYGNPSNISFTDLLVSRVTNQQDAEKEAWYLQSSFTRVVTNWWGGIFPIVQPERIMCTAPVAEVFERGDDYALLAWDSVEGACQLSVAPYGVPADSGMVVSVTDTMYTATGLDSGIYYVARLRTECHHQCPIHDTLVWSPWGQPTLFYLGNTEPQLGLRPIEEEPTWTLSPNPAHGIATVEAQAPLQKVELMTAKGECLQIHNLNGAKRLELNLTGLVPGLYLVRITTANGTSTRRLVLQ